MGQKGSGCVGVHRRDWGAFDRLQSLSVCFGQWRAHAENWSVSWQEDVVTEPSDQGRPGLLLLLKAQRV